jgi:hypothetical protein
MHTLADVVLIIIGVAAVIFVLDAAIRTFVVPRATLVLFTVVVFRFFGFIFRMIAKPSSTYEQRDRVLALFAPFTLLALPLISLAIVFVAYTLIFLGLEHHGWRSAFTTSGSSLLTLGFEKPPDMGSVFAAFSEALIGLSLLALVIAYLPTLYGAFSRRETAVTDLSIRAGTPPTPFDFLKRAQLTGFLYEMDRFWDAWMDWFTEVRETHTTTPALVYFRSPDPQRSWVNAAGAVLDTAALRQSALDVPWTPNAPLMIRSGYLALREIAGFYGFDYAEDPAPDDPITITRDEFDDVCNALAATGAPMRADREQAWKDFAGWRVNYDAVLLELANWVQAPYAPWVSDRTPRTRLTRYPWGRRRRAIARRATH